MPKRLLMIYLLMLTLISPGEASRVLKATSAEEATERGVKISSFVHADGSAGVWLDFPLKPQEVFFHAELEITTGTKTIVTATLEPLRSTPDTVRLYFTTDPELLPGVSLSIIARTPESPYDGELFNLRTFLPLPLNRPAKRPMFL